MKWLHYTAVEARLLLSGLDILNPKIEMDSCICNWSATSYE